MIPIGFSLGLKISFPSRNFILLGRAMISFTAFDKLKTSDIVNYKLQMLFMFRIVMYFRVSIF